MFLIITINGESGYGYRMRLAASIWKRLHNERLVTSLVVLLVGSIVALSAGAFVGLDRTSYNFLHARSPWALDIFAPVIAVGLMIIIIIIWPRVRRLAELISVGAIIVLLEVGELIGKRFWVQPAGSLPSHIAGLALPYSAPSGHAMRATIILGLIGLRLSKRWWPLLGFFLVASCFALVGYGYHYCSDTIVGVLLGSLGIVGINRLVNRSVKSQAVDHE